MRAMLIAPATMIALLLAGCLVILGVIVMSNSGPPKPPPPQIQPPGGDGRCYCGRINAVEAQFCGACGQALR